MKRKQCCALLLAFVMSMSGLPTQVFAEPSKEEQKVLEAVEAGEGESLDAVEVEEESRLGKLEAKEDRPQVEPLYQDDEIVTVIVEMDDAALMDYYGTSTYAAEGGEGATAGEAVSEFLTSEEAQEASEELLSGQDEVISQINGIAGQTEGRAARAADSGVEVVAQWTAAANAMAVKIPYGKLDEVKALKNVKRAYVQHVYERPEPIDNSNVVDGKPNEEYSYDMVDLGSTWQKGYTGKGMLVAVLDSGLDIKLYGTGEDAGKVQYTHEAFTDDSFMSAKGSEVDWNLRYTSDSMEKFLLANQLVSNTGQNGNIIQYDNNALYKNRKVPYGCDYADGDVHIMPSSSDHGTHVAGTVAGCAKTAEGEVKFTGVAPDAQILFMKVFPDEDGGAQEYSIVNALEDSLKLGADLINLSLGSDCGYAVDDTIQNDVFARINASGIAMMTSAGNSDDSASDSNYSGESLASNPDTSVMSSPAIYESNLSVASIDNAINVEPFFTWKDKDGKGHQVSFTDPYSVAMKATFSDKEYPVYKVDGVGTYEDYAAAGFDNGYNNGKTGIAMVQRGEISFLDKINNASSFSGVNSQGERYGILAVIIYDNDPNGTELINMSAEGTALGSAFIRGKDGKAMTDALDSGHQVKIQVSTEDKTVDNETYGEMSSFTSWGPGPGLELKPEITAPGGNIWSTVIDQVNTNPDNYTGSYAMMSGTSMAAPHMTGIGALVRQYITSNKDKFNITQLEMGDMISKLLVSTAIPQRDGDAYYSPRQQGAGLVNADAAVTTPAYITVDGQDIGKLELLDDPDKTGVYDFSFHVNNLTDKSLTYKANIVLMRPDTKTVKSPWGDRSAISDHDVVILEQELGDVVVPASGSVTVSDSVSLDAAQKSRIDELFQNGTYVEGFVILTDAAGKNPQIGLPLLAFYGDWTAAPIFDSANWFDEAQDGENVMKNESTWLTSLMGCVLPNIGYMDLGQNAFREMEGDQTVYHKENFAISPNGDGYLDMLDDQILYQLRNARLIVVEVKDKDTGEVYLKDWASYSFKTTYEAAYGFALPFSMYGSYPVWKGTDAEGNVLPSGTDCIYTITAYGEGDYGDEVYVESEGRDVTDFDAVMNGEHIPTFNGHEMNMEGDVISFPVTVDTVAPKLENNAVTFFEKYGRTYIAGKIYDEDGALASVEIDPYVTRTYKPGYGDPEYSELGVDNSNSFYVNEIYDAGKKTLNFVVDVTEYQHKNEAYPGENNVYDFTWNGDILLSCGDYGANDRSYMIHVDTEEGLVLSQTSARMRPGNEFELSVNDNTIGEGGITRTSSNPEVATIDEFGTVKAIAPGQTVITVSNGKYSGTCVVAVDAHNTKVEDFDLTIESFSGLKPDGECMVKVTNLQPADVVIEENRWVVEEDEDYAEDYAAGLIEVEKYSSDGRSGLLYLTQQQSQELLPAGGATLTVTLNGVSRSMRIDWEDIYTEANQDDLVAAGNFNTQSIYVTQGQTAKLEAKYRQPGNHTTNDIITDFKGLKLDGPEFYLEGGRYQAKLINEEGYALPEKIKVFIVYSADYEYEMQPDSSWGATYTYNSQTGEFVMKSPTGSNPVRIVAEGVESTGNPAGTLSGETYPRPDGLYGPFDWKVSQGNGKLEMSDYTDNYGLTYEVANYTPAEPGVSYITATTKDKKYSVEFAVVSEAVQADKLELNKEEVEMEVGDKLEVNAALTPEPTLDKDKQVSWASFDESVATVENGVITAVSEGYAYIKAYVGTNNKVGDSIVVHVGSKTKPDEPTKIRLSDEELTLDVHERKALTAEVTSANEENKTVTWSSNNPKVATVTADGGRVTALAKGVATITATTADGAAATCKVTVRKTDDPEEPDKNEPVSVRLNKEELSLDVNTTETLTATVMPAEATDKAVIWSSNDTGVATVTSNGKVTAIAAGTATITARTKNGQAGTCKVTVRKADTPVNPGKVEPSGIQLDKETLTLTENESEVITATVAPENAENKSVTWSSNNEKVATVTVNGKVTAIGEGEATITAKTANGLTETCKVIVTKKVKEAQAALKISGIGESLSYGKTATLKAQGGSGSGEITWSVKSGSKYASVDAKTGKVTVKGIGKVTIAATKAGNSQYKDATATIQFKTTLPKKNAYFNVGNARYKVTSDTKGKETLSYAGYTNKNAKKVTIPATVTIGTTSYKVTAIRSKAFKGFKKLTTAVIGKNVTSIGDNAFEGCTSLGKITIPSNVKSIGKKAFYKDGKLKSIKVKSKKVTKVGKNAFKGIHKKAKITVPSAKLSSYKKLFAKKGQAKTVVIKK
ncbi:Ig-like domain-containing protein [Lachnospiraceae bacterium 29-84]